MSGDDNLRERLVHLGAKELSYSDAEFLIASGRIDEAETYLLSHADEFEGDYTRRCCRLPRAWRKMGDGL